MRDNLTFPSKKTSTVKNSIKKKKLPERTEDRLDLGIFSKLCMRLLSRLFDKVQYQLILFLVAGNTLFPQVMIPALALAVDEAAQAAQ